MKDKGFWDGGSPGSSKDGETAGRAAGTPGTRKPRKAGIRTDLEFPEKNEPKR